ncbi:Holliday junction branch migration protein RuvA [Sediminitomix flava]|uniref:Holliday junction branch migration complex subunit RuvA n=1 Tax=Sediminitomix flava TaxID=379075 RepID=A0A315Z9X0_SEDFL|nr:Holliday junction branch migration protein RuvA [Sediminitomix flava]PWJ42331.1 Holliday junction DNA helicase subunit RuvA [Sediminitomix flava]
MYYYLKGKLTLKAPTFIVLDVGGIGYEIFVSLNTSSSLQENNEYKLYTYFHVKEDQQSLFGFTTLLEKELFEALISVSGIGPSTALAVLSSMNPEEVIQAILGEDLKSIQSVKGIGAKTAKRLIIDLKDKVSKLDLPEGFDTSSARTSSSYNPNIQEALEALLQLGFAKPAAAKVLKSVSAKYGNDLSVEDLIKYALKN